jgi:hypothetical protein
MIVRLSRLFSVLTVIVVAACGGGGGGGSGSAGMGTLAVSLTDAPSCGFTAVNVTVSKVRVHQSSSAGTGDGGWTDITLNPARKINLLDLTNGTLAELGQAALQAGHYTQLRLVLTGQGTSNSIILVSNPGVEIPLDTPSAIQSGIKLINQFDVPANQRTDLLIDFDVCKSVVLTGNNTYRLMPVIRVIPFALNGITGFIDSALMANQNASHVRVFAEQNGTVIRATAPASTGEFRLARLEPGTYDVVIAADGRATAVITGVPVAAAPSITSVSTVAQPITLPASSTANVSGTVTLNPANSTVVPFVAAKQSLSPAPAVTVALRPVSLLDFSYTMPLPTAAPLLGSYTTSLPIAFSAAAQGSVAGKYSVSASAEGYQTQNSALLDLSTGGKTFNATLTP